jgi:hypothetical protein
VRAITTVVITHNHFDSLFPDLSGITFPPVSLLPYATIPHHLPPVEFHPSIPRPILCMHGVWESRSPEPAFASGHLLRCVRAIRLFGSVSVTACYLLLHWNVFISFLVVPLLPQIGFIYFPVDIRGTALRISSCTDSK